MRRSLRLRLYHYLVLHMHHFSSFLLLPTHLLFLPDWINFCMVSSAENVRIYIFLIYTLQIPLPFPLSSLVSLLLPFLFFGLSFYTYIYIPSFIPGSLLVCMVRLCVAEFLPRASVCPPPVFYPPVSIHSFFFIQVFLREKREI